MDDFRDDNLEPRKEWATPELKKIDVEAITAAGAESNGDGVGDS